MLKPVASDYDPGYPSRLTQAQIEELLRPDLFRRFSAPVLAAGAVLAGLCLQACAVTPPTAPTPVPAPLEIPLVGLQQKENLEGRRPAPARVQQLIRELLGPGFQLHPDDSLRVMPRRELESNPPVKYPVIFVGFGNSAAGILDLREAQKLTRRLFHEWGLEPKPQQRVTGPGYDFVADGWDAEHKVGYKILAMPGSEQKIAALEVGRGKDPEYGDLSHAELEALDQAVHRGELNMLVVERANFEGFQTARAFYLASVIDYLNWVHGDREIDPLTVLGQKFDKIH